MDSKLPIHLSVTIPQTSLKKIVESGRIMEFVDTFSTLAKAHIAHQIVTQLTSAHNAGISIAVGFDDGGDFYTPPIHHWPWPKGLYEDAMREREITAIANAKTPEVIPLAKTG